jgi:hypothetical protein
MAWTLSALNTLDVVLTLVAAHLGASELNPLTAGLMAPGGPDPFTLAWKLSLPVIAAFGLSALQSRSRWARPSLTALTWLLGAVVLYQVCNLTAVL